MRIIVGIIIYFVFIIGISIISEWLINSKSESFEILGPKLCKNDVDTLFDKTKEYFLNEYNRINQTKMPLDYSPFVQNEQEQNLLQQVSNKLKTYTDETLVDYQFYTQVPGNSIKVPELVQQTNVNFPIDNFQYISPQSLEDKYNPNNYNVQGINTDFNINYGPVFNN